MPAVQYFMARSQEGVCVNMTGDDNIYQVKLMDSLVSSMAFKQVDDHELVR
jgi:hypothetical protein